MSSRYFVRSGWIVCGVWLSVSCFAVLDWEPGGLPCEDGICAEGFSCLVSRCVRDATIEQEATCDKDIQCAAGLICANFQCSKPCTQYYVPTPECAEGEYCGEHLFNGSPRGHCRSDEACGVLGDECGVGKRCVEIVNGASSCLVDCEVSWEVEPIHRYTDSCGSPAARQYCQPLGRHSQLVCRDTGTAPVQLNGACHIVENPCDRGLACINGVCHQYCDPTRTGFRNVNSQCGDLLCCQVTDDFSVCDATCSNL
mgnify:CR=1 FL=1